MKTIKLTNMVVLLISLIFLVSLLALPAFGQEKHKFSSKMYGVNTKSESIDVLDGNEGHKIAISAWKGVGTTASGEQSVFEVQGTMDHINYNGTVSGYQFSRFQDGSTWVVTYEGKITAKPSEAGKPPLVSWGGSWTIVKGTGKYENVEGGGTFKARFIAPEIYLNEAEGEYVIKKK
jgi:hypothetical protein